MFQEIDNLIAQGAFYEANVLLERLYENANNHQKVEVIKRFMVTIKGITDTDRLLKLAEEAILISTAYGKWDEVLYFESKKLIYLTHELSMMVYRQKNLKLAENVFPWIGFALESNKEEYEYIAELSANIEEKAQKLADTIIEDLKKKDWSSSLVARIYLELADYYSTLYLHYLQKFMSGGRVKSKFANNRYVRWWNLFLFLYTKDERKKIVESRELSFQYAQLSVDEFTKDSDKSGKAHALYNYAIKLNTCSKFSKALRVLKEAQATLDKKEDGFLLDQIIEYSQLVKNKNRGGRDYVEELGLARPSNYG